MKLHAFVAMPYGRHPGDDGTAIDFDRVYRELIAPALAAADLEVLRADEAERAGDIRADMFQELLLADLVVADLTIDNPNVWYELGVRHALRARGVLLLQGPRRRPAFDTAGERRLLYSLKDGAPDPSTLADDVARLAAMARATLESWHGRKISPVYQRLPNLREPDWRQLAVGDAREFWQRHAEWERQVDRARGRRRPGDVLVLADETPVIALRAEAFHAAGEALRRLEHFDFALEQYERCLDVDPGHLAAARMKTLCLLRLGRSDEARVQVQALLAEHPRDAASWGLRGRIDEEAWVAAWQRPGADRARRRDDAAYEDALLAAAIDSHLGGFRADANHFASGIRALTLLHLYRDLTGRRDRDTEIGALEGGVRWAAWSTARLGGDFDAAATLGDLQVLTGTPEDVGAAYREAIRRLEHDWFALAARRAGLARLDMLGFRPDAVAAGLATFDRALERLALPAGEWQPRQVILFSGHIVDAPGRTPPRFPATMEPAAAAAIAGALAALDAGPEDLALTQGAAGGDLIFLEAARARGLKLQLMLPFDEPRFVEQSVACRGAAWTARYDAVRAALDPTRPPRCAPAELGEAPVGVDPYERCNQWLLYTALAAGLDRVRLIALWNGGGGDGLGGTQHMVREVKRRTGRVHWIDTRSLG